MRILPILLLAILLFGCAQQQPASQPANQTQYPAPSQPTNTQPNSPNSTTQNPQSSPSASQNTTPTLESTEVSYNSNGWTIYGSYYTSQDRAPSKAILLLPGLGTARDAFPQYFVQGLHDQIPDAAVLALDLRGQGKSNNLGNWQNFTTQDFYQMKVDVTSAETYLHQNYPTIKEFYVVGASVGSTAGITAAAQDQKITKVVLMSPGMDFNGVDITSSLAAYPFPLLAVASSGDAYSAQTVGYIQSMGDSEAQTMIYSGISAHGTGLFDATKDFDDPVSNQIIQFLK